MSTTPHRKLKGIVLAGGYGTRLQPMTRIINKHLLPVYDQPMVYYPLRALALAGIEDVLLVTGGNHSGDFQNMIGQGSEFGFRTFTYAKQEGAGGIAHALRLAEEFAEESPIIVMLGDNIFQDPIKPIINTYLAQLDKQHHQGAHIVIKDVNDPGRFGVVEFDNNDNIIAIHEKPEQPASHSIVTGLYLYDHRVFDIIKTLKPSPRGELEITDVNNQYLREHKLSWSRVNGWWVDAGTFPSLYRASKLVVEYGVGGEPLAPFHDPESLV